MQRGAEEPAYPDRATWSERMQTSPVRVQWDPERSITLEPLPWRSIQIGLSGSVIERYVNRWTVDITDITPLVRETHAGIAEPSTFPRERPYPLGSDLGSILGTSG